MYAYFLIFFFCCIELSRTPKRAGALRGRHLNIRS